MFTLEEKEYGKKAYELYCEFTDNKSLVTGDVLPKWDDLNNDIQDAWTYSASNVIEYYLKNNKQGI